MNCSIYRNLAFTVTNTWEQETIEAVAAEKLSYFTHSVPLPVKESRGPTSSCRSLPRCPFM